MFTAGLFVTGQKRKQPRCLSAGEQTHKLHYIHVIGCPGGPVVKSLPVNAGDTRDTGLISGSGKCPGVGNDNPL